MVSKSAVYSNHINKEIAIEIKQRQKQKKINHHLNIMAVQLFQPINFHRHSFIREHMATSFQDCCYCIPQSHKPTEKSHTDFEGYPWWYNKWRIRNPFLNFESIDRSGKKLYVIICVIAFSERKNLNEVAHQHKRHKLRYQVGATVAWCS